MAFRISFLFALLDLRTGRQDDSEKSSDEDEEEKRGHAPTVEAAGQTDGRLMHQMFVLRFNLMHFVNNLHTYVMTRVSRYVWLPGNQILRCPYLVMVLYVLILYFLLTDSPHHRLRVSALFREGNGEKITFKK